MKKYILTLAALFIISFTLFAQISLRYRICSNCSSEEGADNLTTDYEYGTIKPYKSEDVTSDFGARYLGYDWHKGVDYRPLQYAGTDDGGRGTAIVAAETGTVHLIRATGGYKYIAIEGENQHHFGYGHIFNSRNPTNSWLQSGSLVLKAMDSTNPPLYAIINLETGKAIGQEEGTVTLNGTTYIVKTEIESNSEIIAPMGGSGGGYQNNDPFPAHLHLYRFRNINSNPIISESHETNCIDPLTVISHQFTNYEIKFQTQGENFGQIKLNYPGTTPTKFKVRAIMIGATNPNGVVLGENGTATRYGNVVMDLNDIKVLLKKQYESGFSIIQGATFESRISHGATLATTLYPTYMADDDQRGSWTNQGIASFAYSNYPYDEFYFTDFITRIRKGHVPGNPVQISYCPWNTKYNDGRYAARFQVTNVQASNQLITSNFTIDNYKPFIRSVKVEASGNKFYEKTWNCDDPGCQGMKLTTLPVVPNIHKSDVLGGLYVTIEASEPLQTCALQVNELTNITQTWQQEDGRIRQFLISPAQVNTLLSAQSIELKFTGKDWSNNALLALNSVHASASCVEIPKRTGANSWEDDMSTGTDVVHFFNPGCGAPRDGEPTLTIIPDESCFNYGTGITWETIQPSNQSATDGVIALHVEGGIEPYSYAWSTGATTSKLEGIGPGEYCVTVNDALCCEQVVCITLCPKITIPDTDAGGPSTCNGSDGQIYFRFGGPEGGTPPYTYLWNTGATTLSLFYIPSGVYSLTVTDANGCTAEASYTLLAAGEPMVIFESAPGCQGMNNGYVNAGAFTPDGFGGPYHFVWSSGFIDLNTYYSELNNVGAGNYCVTITDANGGGACPVVRCAELSDLVPDGPLTLKKEAVVNSCAESASGSITLDISGGITPQPGGIYAYTIQWANGLGSSQTLQNLAPGTYCYTVTDYCGATASNCVEVEEQENTGFDLELLAIQHVSEPDLNDGLISVAPTVAGEYSFEWSNHVSGSGINSLATGSYSVTATSLSTGCSIIRSYTIENCFEVPNFNARLIGDLVGSEPATFRVQVSVGNGAFSGNIPPGFSIVWEAHQDGIIGHGAMVTLPANFTGNWIKATISNGCVEKVLSKQILRCPMVDPGLENPAGFFIANRRDPCRGFSDGSITLAIPKPGSGAAVTAVLDGNFEIPVSGGDDDFYYIEIGNLAGNVDYSIKITVGDCEYEFTFRLGERTPEQQFDHLDANDICFFNESCDGILFNGANQFQEIAVLDWFNSTGGPFEACRTPLLCSNRREGDKSFSKRQVRAIEYKNTLLTAINAGTYGEGYVDPIFDWANLQTVGFSPPCRRVKYCRGNLRYVSKGPVLWPFGQEVNDDGNCMTVTCPIGDYLLVCPENADLFGGSTGIIDNCSPRSRNVLELIFNRSALAEEFGNLFTQSSLKTFLDNEESNPAAACAYVVYCRSDFSFISSNIATTNCNVPLYSCGTYVGESCTTTPVTGPTGQIAGYRSLCQSSASSGNCPPGSPGVGEPTVIRFCLIPPTPPAPPSNPYLCPRFFQPENFTEDPIIKVILDTYDEEQLLNFGIAQEGDLINPNGLTNTAQGFVLDDFDPFGNQVFKQKVDTVVTHYVSDWEKEITVYVEALQPDTAYQLIYEDTSDFWIKPIATSPGGLVQVRHLSVSQGQSDVILAGGTFQGDLVYDGAVIATAAQASGFLLRVRMEDGGVADFNTFMGLSDLVFSENRKNAVVVAGKRSGDILVNNQTWAMPSGAGVTAIRVDEQNQIALVDNIELQSGTFGLADIATRESDYDPDSPVSIALWGSGAILAGNQSLSYPADHLVILTVTHQGAPVQVAATPAANLDQDGFDMAYDKAGDVLFAGFTITNTVNLFGESFQSAGGQDIVLAAIRPDGILGWNSQYGGTENENVSKILQNHDVLYFGGAFDGSVGDKTIGQYIFSNLVAATQRAYISFVSPWSAGGVVALSEQEQGVVPAADILSPGPLVHQPETRVEVFPNPFNNKVRVRAFGENIAAIQVVNALGQPVYDFRDQTFSDFEIDFGENAKGIYFLKCYNHTGGLVATKSVVKMN